MCFPSQSLHTILRVCVYRRDGGSCNIQTSLYGIYNDNNTQSANNNVGPLIYRRPVWTLTRQLLDPFISDCNWAKAVRLYCITLTEVPAVVRETGMYFHITSLNRIELNPSWRCHEGLAERIRDLFSSPWHCRSFLSGWRLSFFSLLPPSGLLARHTLCTSPGLLFAPSTPSPQSAEKTRWPWIGSSLPDASNL